jgi:hypothetical protein
MTTCYYWDFFGPDAEQTAVHFRHHLDEFLTRESLLGCETGLMSKGSGHHAAWCRAPEPAGASIARTLRPRRREGPASEG